MSMKNNPAIIFFGWGPKYIDLVTHCIRESQLPPYPIFLITDTATDIGGLPAGIEVVRHASKISGNERHTELFLCLPKQIETALLLDADTRVIGDVSLGFEKAEKHGIAMVPAPHYSLADFRDFRQVMLKEGVTPLGQIIYNSGVIFCAPHRPDVQAVFESTLVLAKKYRDQVWSDQTYLSLAIELQCFNPYTLSPSFNYLCFGELINGSHRIWHCYVSVPKNVSSHENRYH